MSACAIEVMQMTHGQTIEDIAAGRLEEWDRWMNRGPKVGPQEPHCTLGRVQEQRVAAGDQGGPQDIPLSVDETERAVRQLSPREKRLNNTFFEHTPMDIKARDCGLTRSGYWRAIQRMRRRVYSLLY